MKASQSRAADGSGGRKKAYCKPKTLSREQLEALAVDCGGTGKTDGLSCSVGPIQS